MTDVIAYLTALVIIFAAALAVSLAVLRHRRHDQKMVELVDRIDGVEKHEDWT